MLTQSAIKRKKRHVRAHIKKTFDEAWCVRYLSNTNPTSQTLLRRRFLVSDPRTRSARASALFAQELVCKCLVFLFPSFKTFFERLGQIEVTLLAMIIGSLPASMKESKDARGFLPGAIVAIDSCVLCLCRATKKTPKNQKRET